MRHAFAAIALSILATASSAQVSVPFTFSAGSAARASEVNGNFQALVTGINALADRVTKLEGNIVTADLVGTYAWSGLQVGLIAGGTVETISYSGTATLAADGTLSGTLSERGFDLFPGGNRVPRTADDAL